MNESIPEDIKRFFLANIDSVAQWEGLLLLREHPDMEWSAQAAAQRLYVNEAEIGYLLTQLVSRQVLVSTEKDATGLYQYKPQSAELKNAIDQAADFYRRYLIPVTHLIHSKSANRFQEFANAFRIRKD